MEESSLQQLDKHLMRYMQWLHCERVNPVGAILYIAHEVFMNEIYIRFI